MRQVANMQPVGIMPRFIWIEKRLDEIQQAIERRFNTTYEIPLEWVQERNELVKELERVLLEKNNGTVGQIIDTRA